MCYIRQKSRTQKGARLPADTVVYLRCHICRNVQIRNRYVSINVEARTQKSRRRIANKQDLERLQNAAVGYSQLSHFAVDQSQFFRWNTFVVVVTPTSCHDGWSIWAAAAARSSTASGPQVNYQLHCVSAWKQKSQRAISPSVAAGSAATVMGGRNPGTTSGDRGRLNLDHVHARKHRPRPVSRSWSRKWAYVRLKEWNQTFQLAEA